MHRIFRDRVEAGQILAGLLAGYSCRDDVIVLALPRGGVPVAFEVACRLHAPLDVLLVRKLGAPGDEEIAFGAIAAGGVEVFDEILIQGLHLPPARVDEIVRRERRELARREQCYRGGRPFPDLADRIVTLVDDGIATGATMSAAVRAARRHGARSVIVAAPVASADAVGALRHDADDVVVQLVADDFIAVGAFYGDFQPTSDTDVRTLLVRAEARTGRLPQGGAPA